MVALLYRWSVKKHWYLLWFQPMEGLSENPSYTQHRNQSGYRPAGTLQQPGTSSGWLQTHGLLDDSLKVRNSILHTHLHYNLFPTTLTFLIIIIMFHLFTSTPTNIFAKMNSETMTKKWPVDILTHKNWREWFQLIELYFTGEELDFVLHQTEEEYCAVLGFMVQSGESTSANNPLQTARAWINWESR